MSSIGEQNREDAEKCVQIAETAFADKDYNKAERFLLKAERISSSELTKRMLADVKDARRKFTSNDDETLPSTSGQKLTETAVEGRGTSNEYNEHLREAENCLSKAKLAYESGDLIKARHCCEKAEKLVPQKLLPHKLKEELIALNKNLGVRENNNDEEYFKRKEADQFIARAKESVENQHYYSAQLILEKAQKVFPTNEAKEMLYNVKQDIKKNIERSKKPTKDAEMEEKRKEHDNLMKKAANKIKQQDYEMAKTLVIMADNCIVTSQSQEMMRRIFLNEYNSKFENASLGPPDFKTYEAQQYKELAKRVFHDGDFNLAEHYLQKCIVMDKSVDTKKWLGIVRDAKASRKGIIHSFISNFTKFWFLEDSIFFGDSNEGSNTEARKKFNESCGPSTVDEMNDFEDICVGDKQSTSKTETEKPRGIEVTPEHFEAIRRVNEAQNDYDILGVDKTSSFAAMKKAYKLRTLQLHPDKNIAPGAREAFMTLNEAYDRLKIDQRRPKIK